VAGGDCEGVAMLPAPSGRAKMTEYQVEETSRTRAAQGWHGDDGIGPIFTGDAFDAVARPGARGGSYSCPQTRRRQISRRGTARLYRRSDPLE